MTDHPTTAFKILDRAEWQAAKAAGAYDGSPVDLADGYIHLSTQAQLTETVRKHYAGRRDLMLLTVDLAATDVTWEPSRGGDLFPHLYAPLPVQAVTEARPVSVSPDGQLVFEEPAS